MWLLKLHFALSILILITFLGFKWACKELIVKNGWLGDEPEKGKKKYKNYIGFFVPVLNIFMLIGLFVMVALTKEEFDKMGEGKNNG